MATYSARDSQRGRAQIVPASYRYTPLKPVNKDRISYFYDCDVSEIHYGSQHPMKPQRMALTHDLVMCYGLHERLQMFEPRLATEEEMKQFHISDYIDFLRYVTPHNMHAFKDQLQEYNVGDDCPIFEGLYKFCRISSGGSIEAARKINRGESDIAINWSGGLHHAKKVEASGFCYVNDIVLAIMELLRYHQRVVYIDIDVHHGDGVQDAFYMTNRVLTVSFHRFGPTSDGHDFFPGTGSLDQHGEDEGKYHAVNVPLKAGMDDTSYVALFKQVMDRVMEVYRPGAIVMQCGADSLGCDRLGCFCLSIKGHGQCVAHMKRHNVPMVVLGGGGYTVPNVARCWAYETGLLVDADLPNKIPPHANASFYRPDFTLFPKIQDQLRNENSQDDIARIRTAVFEQLQHLEHAPSVQMHAIPPEIDGLTEDGWAEYRDKLADQQADLDARVRLGVIAAARPQTQAAARYAENELYADEADQDGNFDGMDVEDDEDDARAMDVDMNGAPGGQRRTRARESSMASDAVFGWADLAGLQESAAHGDLQPSHPHASAGGGAHLGLSGP
ncbi:hypothetical protein GGF32_005510 [Allomyces javanicus]|nr:hypothetical protein GGF32_005510 [Allomyces javanicus]